MANIRLVFFTIVIVLSLFIFVYGGYDDSPGAQMLGLLVMIGGIVAIVKKRKP